MKKRMREISLVDVLLCGFGFMMGIFILSLVFSENMYGALSTRGVFIGPRTLILLRAVLVLTWVVTSLVGLVFARNNIVAKRTDLYSLAILPLFILLGSMGFALKTPVASYSAHAVKYKALEENLTGFNTTPELVSGLRDSGELITKIASGFDAWVEDNKNVFAELAWLSFVNREVSFVYATGDFAGFIAHTYLRSVSPYLKKDETLQLTSILIQRYITNEFNFGIRFVATNLGATGFALVVFYFLLGFVLFVLVGRLLEKSTSRI